MSGTKSEQVRILGWYNWPVIYTRSWLEGLGGSLPQLLYTVVSTLRDVKAHQKFDPILGQS